MRCSLRVRLSFLKALTRFQAVFSREDNALTFGFVLVDAAGAGGVVEGGLSGAVDMLHGGCWNMRGEGKE